MHLSQLNRLSILGAFALLTACSGTEDPATDQHAHLDALGVELVDLANDSVLSRHLDPEHVADAGNPDTLRLQLGTEREIGVRFLCVHEHEGEHTEVEGELHPADELEPCLEEGDAYAIDADKALVVAVGDSLLLQSTQADDLRAVLQLDPLAAGTTSLGFEMLHNGHADIAQKLFPVVVTP